MQLPVPNNPVTNVPLALGYLKAYAHAQGLLDQIAIEIMPRALADYAGDALLVRAIVARCPHVLGVSLYTWNSERTLRIAQRVKQQLPDLVVVVGGPEVQRDNRWVLEHPAVDLAVIGEGEQTFADLLRYFLAVSRQPSVVSHQEPKTENQEPERERTQYATLATIPGLAFRHNGAIHFTPDRVALSDLAEVPSPYLLGYLEMPPYSMVMIEVSRWCPYACAFCLYGRNMGTKLGNRYFGLERVLEEIRWGREQGATSIHFIEANLNLVPLFWPLMSALEDFNADRQITFYAELRGEHLTDAVVDALDRANVRYVEVGLQTANPAALRASHRRTDLHKWAAGTRRLYNRQIEVFLDVILGLPADDPAGVQQTLDFIGREALGPYDIFTLQVLPGTAVREGAAQYGLVYQDRPPYYVLATDRFSFADLRTQRRALKLGADLDPDAIEGIPQPRTDALIQRDRSADADQAIDQLSLLDHDMADADQISAQLASHVDLLIDAAQLHAITPLIAQ